MRNLLSVVAAGAVVIAAAGSLVADDLDLGTTIDSLKASVTGKHYGKALSDVQSVMAEVSRLRADSLKTLFPDAPSGWTAEEAEVDGNPALTALAMGVVAHRAYAKGESRITLELSVGGMWHSQLSGLVGNPMFSSATNKQVTVKGRKGMLDTSNAENGRSFVQLLLNGAPAVLKIDGQGVTRDDIEKVFGGAFDFDKAEKLVND